MWVSGATCKATFRKNATDVTGNDAGGRGGGIAVVGGASLKVENDAAVEENEAEAGGGGILASDCPTVTLDGTGGLVSIRNNIVHAGDGGGILVLQPGRGGAAPLVNLKTVEMTGNKAYGTVLRSINLLTGVETVTYVNGGQGGGIAVFGAVTVDADTDTVVSDNGQSASAPLTAPSELGVYFDAAVLATSTFFDNAVVEDNYQFGP